MMVSGLHYKDQILDELAREHNVAQFVSFGADLRQRYARVSGFEPNHAFPSRQDAIGKLLERSSDHAVNVRSFAPDQPRSREFLQNLKTVDAVSAHLTRLGAAGLITIVNETIDVSDGGVSGVATPTTLEFAPDSTPRAVEEEGVARLPRELGDRLLQTVYGFAPEAPTGRDLRLEFSIHPRPRGWLRRHTVLWEREVLAPAVVRTILPARPSWPNKFSRFLGDKAYGLLMAWLAGIAVPHTTVIGRRFAPFMFGDQTGQFDVWIRTCPAERTPGHFATIHGWSDPFELMAREDDEPLSQRTLRHARGVWRGAENLWLAMRGAPPLPHEQRTYKIASVLCQRGVLPKYSGAAITEADGGLRVEGVEGAGEAFMLTGAAQTLPDTVVDEVRNLARKLAMIFGPVSFEWVFDGTRPWIVQLHVGRSASHGDVIYPGERDEWVEVPASTSLEQLRILVARLDREKTGVLLLGSIGTSSHKGDLLRKAEIPSRLRHPSSRKIAS